MSMLDTERAAGNGRTTARPQLDTGPAYATEARGVGWIAFAAIMLALGGIVGLIDGIVAVSKSSFFVADAQYVFSDLYTWGWIAIFAGAIAVAAAFGVMARSEWGRWAGIVVASGQAVVQLLMVQSYPIWSLTIFVLDVLVVYALAVYGGRRTELDI
jgi:hypothetical protein